MRNDSAWAAAAAGVRRTRWRTAVSSRRRSRSSAGAAARLSWLLSSRAATLRRAARSATSSLSADGRTGVTRSTVPRHRSLHSRNSRASLRRTACRSAMSASAAPLAVASVRSSVAPRVCRCRSSRARPRSHAASMPRQRCSASHQVAWASQPTLRVRSSPRCRAFAAERRWRAASSRRPAASASWPVSRWALTARAGSSSSSRAVTRRAARSSAAGRSGSAADRHSSRTSSARAAHHGRC